MRQIVLDTETTGLEYARGDRVIEIGCVELVNRRLSGRRFHKYVNPDREIEAGAMAVHGITNEFLQDKPRFAEIADEFMDFVRGAELVIHNAAFDVGFLEHELRLAQRQALAEITSGTVDTLRLAKELQPGRRASLDALCERYDVSNAHRTLHGALLDAQLLAEVYLAMTRGQESLIMDLAPAEAIGAAAAVSELRAALVVVRASPEELEEHARVLQEVQKESKGRCLWLAQSVEQTNEQRPS